MGQNQNIEIRFFNHQTVDQKGQRKIKMIVVDHLNSGQLFGNDDSKTLFESKLEMNELENHLIVFQSIHHGHQRPKPVHFVDRNFPPHNLKQHVKTIKIKDDENKNKGQGIDTTIDDANQSVM
jgi:hypothetical protein